MQGKGCSITDEIGRRGGMHAFIHGAEVLLQVHLSVIVRGTLRVDCLDVPPMYWDFVTLVKDDDWI